MRVRNVRQVLQQVTVGAALDGNRVRRREFDRLRDFAVRARDHKPVRFRVAYDQGGGHGVVLGAVAGFRYSERVGIQGVETDVAPDDWSTDSAGAP